MLAEYCHLYYYIHNLINVNIKRKCKNTSVDFEDTSLLIWIYFLHVFITYTYLICPTQQEFSSVHRTQQQILKQVQQTARYRYQNKTDTREEHCVPAL